MTDIGELEPSELETLLADFGAKPFHYNAFR